MKNLCVVDFKQDLCDSCDRWTITRFKLFLRDFSVGTVVTILGDLSF